MTNPNGSTPDYEGDYSGMGGTAGAIGAVSGVFDTWLNASTSRRNTDKTIEAQRAEAELAYQRQVEMWHMQNAYNSPMEQMKRFGAAGLNPNLIYGQGSSGNSSKFPEYQAPNLQYRYEAPQYGAAAMSAIEQLMQVGTWMQNMKLSQQQFESRDVGLDFSRNINPLKLREFENRLSTFPYQKSLQRYLSGQSYVKMADMFEEFRHKFGDDSYGRLMFDADYPGSVGDTQGGIRKLQFLEQLAKSKIAGAKASWTDMNITDPQALMQLVLGGVMGMAGTTLRLNMKSRNVAPVKEGFRQKWTPPAINRRRRGFQR